MAARKRPEGQSSLFVAPAVPAVTATLPTPIAPPEATPVVAERIVRLVPPPEPVPECDVIIEALDDGRYIVSLLRDHGTTVAAVTYTRAQLKMLLRRIPAALEIG